MILDCEDINFHFNSCKQLKVWYICTLNRGTLRQAQRERIEIIIDFYKTFSFLLSILNIYRGIEQYPVTSTGQGTYQFSTLLKNKL